VIGNDFNVPERIAINFFNLKEIDTIYIPHAAIPIIHELTLKSNVKYFALGGESDKNYYTSKGINEEKIRVVGTPRYERIYASKIATINQV
jgi:hypothetical protein